MGGRSYHNICHFFHRSGILILSNRRYIFEEDDLALLLPEEDVLALVLKDLLFALFLGWRKTRLGLDLVTDPIWIVLLQVIYADL